MADLAGLTATIVSAPALSVSSTLNGKSLSQTEVAYAGNSPANRNFTLVNPLLPGAAQPQSNDDEVKLSSEAKQLQSGQDGDKGNSSTNPLVEQLRAGTLEAKNVGDAFRASFQQAGLVFADFMRKIGASEDAIATSLKTFLVDTEKAAGDQIRHGGFHFAAQGEALSLNVTDIHMQLNASGPKGSQSLTVDFSSISVNFASYSVTNGAKAPVPSIELSSDKGNVALDTGTSAPKLTSALQDLGLLSSQQTLPLKPLKVLGGEDQLPKMAPFNLSIVLGMPLRLQFSPANVHVNVNA